MAEENGKFIICYPQPRLSKLKGLMYIILALCLPILRSYGTKEFSSNDTVLFLLEFVLIISGIHYLFKQNQNLAIFDKEARKVSLGKRIIYDFIFKKFQRDKILRSFDFSFVEKLAVNESFIFGNRITLYLTDRESYCIARGYSKKERQRITSALNQILEKPVVSV